MNATNSRSKRGELAITYQTLMLNPCEIISYGFIITLKNKLKISKDEYGSKATAEQAGKLTAKHYNIDITPVRKHAKREGMK